MMAWQQWLLRRWYAKAPSSSASHIAWALLSLLLVPLSWITLWVSKSRAKQLKKPRSSLAHQPVVVVVGNLVAGGAGKTPVVLALREQLAPYFGPIGVIARGFADEAAQLRQGDRGPVSTHFEREKALTQLMANAPLTQVVLSDDGLQHMGLARDLELLVIDRRGFGNQRLLPAGPLRESEQRIDSIDAVILSNWDQAILTHPCHASFGALPVFATQTVVTGFYPLSEPQELRPLASLLTSRMRIGAVAAIAQPEAFFSLLDTQLKSQGVTLSREHCLALPDHSDLSAPTLEAMRSRLGLDAIVVTEKDAVKCLPSENAALWVMAIQAQLPPELVNYVVAQIHKGLHGPALN